MPSGARDLLLIALPQNSPNLFYVVSVVSGHVAAESTHRHGPALAVNAVRLPFFKREPADHAEVRFPQQPKHLQRIFRPPSSVIAKPRPQILVKSRKRDSWALNHLAVPPTGGQLIFGQVGQNLSDRPFRGPRARGELLEGNSLDQFGQQARRLSLHRDGVFAVGVSEQTRWVVRCIGHRLILIPDLCRLEMRRLTVLPEHRPIQ
jgi:hypothetical protein